MGIGIISKQDYTFQTLSRNQADFYIILTVKEQIFRGRGGEMPFFWAGIWVNTPGLLQRRGRLYSPNWFPGLIKLRVSILS
jgi:hypothetical protein